MEGWDHSSMCKHSKHLPNALTADTLLQKKTRPFPSLSPLIQILNICLFKPLDKRYPPGHGATAEGKFFGSGCSLSLFRFQVLSVSLCDTCCRALPMSSPWVKVSLWFCSWERVSLPIARISQFLCEIFWFCSGFGCLISFIRWVFLFLKKRERVGVSCSLVSKIDRLISYSPFAATLAFYAFLQVLSLF